MNPPKTWNRVGTWEKRAYKDLLAFITPVDDFKFIRRAIEDVKPLMVGSQTQSVVNGGGIDASAKGKSTAEQKPPVPACVPFIGTNACPSVMTFNFLTLVQEFIFRSSINTTSSPT